MTLKRRVSYQPAQKTSMVALTISVIALLLTLLNTTLRTPHGIKITPGSSQTALDIDAVELLPGVAAAAAAASRSGSGGAAIGDLPSSSSSAAAAAAAAAAPGRTVSFQVCNGFANQRLALVYGLVVAKQLGRAAVLPTLILDGTQLTGADRLAGDDAAATADFEEFYDLAALRAALAAHGVRAVTRGAFEAARRAAEAAGGSKAAGGLGSGGSSSGGGGDIVQVSLAAARPIDDVPWHFTAHREARHLALDCPLFKLSPSAVLAERKFVWAVLGALRPAAAVQRHVDAALAQLEGRPFNFLHIRLERDWQAHCARCGRKGWLSTHAATHDLSMHAAGVHAINTDERMRPPAPPQVGRPEQRRRRGPRQLLQQHADGRVGDGVDAPRQGVFQGGGGCLLDCS
jgi:hypothetical protein